MTKFLPAAFGVVLGLSCLGAQAMPTNDTPMMRYSGVNELTQPGNYVVDYIEGRLVPDHPGGGAPKAGPGEASDAADYAASNIVMTIGLFAALASALAGFAVFGGFSRKAVLPDATSPERREDAWKETLLEMLEADLRSLDSVSHGFSSR